MTKKLLLIVITALANTFCITYLNRASSDSSLYIYGTITTESDRQYTGQIRWGDEEAFWFDFFNSSKPTNDFIEYLTEEELDQLHENDLHEGIFKKRGKHWNWNWNGHNGKCDENDHTHAFSCRFGDIASIEIGNRDRIKLQLKNGESIRLKGGSNDIGADIQITDAEIGHIRLDWDEIVKVEFANTPSNLENHYGEPLYGTVKTLEDSFTGYLQWDHDERMTKDELNGKHEDGNMDIPFGSITSIKPKRRGSEVQLKSGRSFYLTGTNDVNRENRGIIVNIEGLGRVDIPWAEFVEIQFTDPPSSSNVDYASFNKGSKAIRGNVQLESGNSSSGVIIFDLDEQYLCEILNGNNDDIEYFIPFANIHKITPISRSATKVELKSGKTIELKESVDVSDDNDGILVFESNQDHPTYLTWSTIETITID